jgi:hypothetical protein
LKKLAGRSLLLGVTRVRSIKISGRKLAALVEETGLSNEGFCAASRVSRGWLASKMNKHSVSADRDMIKRLAAFQHVSVPEMIERLSASPMSGRLGGNPLADIPEDLLLSFQALAESHGLKPVDLLRRLVEEEKAVVRE